MGFIPEWAIGVGFIVVAISIARALGGGARALRSAGSPRRLPSDDAEVAELRQTVESLQQRLAEVEERLDFAERLLAKPPR